MGLGVGVGEGDRVGEADGDDLGDANAVGDWDECTAEDAAALAG